jgi:hypothetical protein
LPVVHGLSNARQLLATVHSSPFVRLREGLILHGRRSE